MSFREMILRLHIPLMAMIVSANLAECRLLRRAREMPENAAVCTEEQCRQTFLSMNLGGSFYVNDYSTKGCFYKAKHVYFGTGGTVEQISETDLPGVRERLWCHAETNPPTVKPTKQLTANPTRIPVTGGPTKQPTTKSVTGNPTKQPTRNLITDNPTVKPTITATGNLTKQPTPKSITDSKPSPGMNLEFLVDEDVTWNLSEAPKEEDGEHMEPSAPLSVDSVFPLLDVTADPILSPPTSKPSLAPTPRPTERPSKKPSSKPTHFPTPSPSPAPTERPSSVPTKIPSSAPTSNPSHVPSKRPSLKPTESPSPGLHASSYISASPNDISPWIAPLPGSEDTAVSLEFTKPPIEKNSTVAAMAMSPFTMTLQTAPQTETVDVDELSYLISSHLLTEMQTKFTDAEVTNVYVNVSSVSDQRRQIQQTGLVFASDVAKPKEHDFQVSGEAHFAGSSPTLENLDSVTKESFEGVNGNMFVRSLQNAEDSRLQSTRSVSVEKTNEPANSEKGEISESYLPSVTEDPIVGDPLYVLGIVFGVGFILVAMYVMKTRRGRKIELENEMNAAEDNDEESAAIPEFPKFIEVEKAAAGESPYETPCSFYGSIRQALSDKSESGIEPPSPKASDMSVLTDPHILTQNSSESIDQFLPAKTQDSSSGKHVDVHQASPENMSAIPISAIPMGLPSISETTDNRSGKPLEDDGWLDMCGAYDEPQSNAKSSSGASTVGSTQDSARKAHAKQQGMGSFWGKNPDDGSSDYSQSDKTSRMSSRLSMTDTHSVSTGMNTWSQIPDDLISEDAASRQTTKMCNTKK